MKNDSIYLTMLLLACAAAAVGFYTIDKTSYERGFADGDRLGFSHTVTFMPKTSKPESLVLKTAQFYMQNPVTGLDKTKVNWTK